MPRMGCFPLIAALLTAWSALPSAAQSIGSGALRAQPARVPQVVSPIDSSVVDAAAPREVLIAARSLPARSIVAADDVVLAVRPASARALSSPEAVVGRETRGAIPAGRALRAEDLADAAVIERNERVTLNFRAGALSISTEGTALDRAGIGRRVRVMNLTSRRTVVGVASGPGVVEVER